MQVLRKQNKKKKQKAKIKKNKKRRRRLAIGKILIFIINIFISMLNKLFGT